MAVATKGAAKKTAKKVPGKAARRSRYAGRVAPPLVSPPTESPVMKPVIQIDPSDLDRMVAIGEGFAEGVRRVEAAAKVITEQKDPGEKQLHRRVVTHVYDAADVLIATNTYRLAVTDVLSFGVTSKTVSGVVSTQDAR